MNDRSPSQADSTVPDFCDRGIAAIFAEPMPTDAQERTLQVASHWRRSDEVSVPVSIDAGGGRPHSSRDSRTSGLRNWKYLAALSIVAAVGVGSSFMSRNEQPSGPPLESAHSFFMPTPASVPMTADEAPIVVACGPSEPARLGQQFSRNELQAGLPLNQVRLHIWNWSKSDLSRVIVTKRVRQGVISPDGSQLIDDSGNLVDLAKGTIRQFPGFTADEERPLSVIGFSPTGRFVAAMKHLRTEVNQVRRFPPLQENRHLWALRIFEFASGQRVAEWPAAPSAGVRFSNDESEFFYSDPENRITRRDLKSGAVLNQYAPALEPHGAVGLAISPDGQTIAAGHYHGELFLWDRATGRLLLDHRFRQSTGEHDNFFQAKLLKFSPDGQQLAMASGSRLKVLEVPTGKILAEHYHASTPDFVQLRWAESLEEILLVAAGSIAEYSPRDSFPPVPTAELLPRIYHWNWKTDAPQPR